MSEEGFAKDPADVRRWQFLMKRRKALLGSNLLRDSQDERGEAGLAKPTQLFTERPGVG